MSSLIVLCPHCLTWIEVHAGCCTECGGTVSIEDRDPAEDVLAERLGDCLADIGTIKLLRRGWPDCGRLVGTTTGLLYLPHFSLRPNGALEAEADSAPAGSSRVANLFQWWSLPPWRRPMEPEVPPQANPTMPSSSLLTMLFDSPGAFFIQRTSIQSVGTRWGRVQIERRPSRSVSLAQAPGGLHPRDVLRSLIEFAPWRSIVASL